MTSLPLVSIIIATYKREHELTRAIKSVAEQTYNNIELIVVDDNDETSWNEKVKMLVDCNEPLFHKDERTIVYMRNDSGRGPGNARNFGASKASGEYIEFLDDDDLYLPEKTEKQVRGVVAASGDFSLMNSLLFDDNENLVLKTNREETKSLSCERLLVYHIMHNLTNPNTMMFRKEYFILVGGFGNINIGEEYYLIEKAIINRGKYVYIDEYQTKSYIHSSQTSSLSVGKRKINGENYLYHHKKEFFNLLTKKQRKYVKVRHYAVIAYTYLRIKSIRFVPSMIMCFLVSPKESLRLFRERKGKA